MKTIRISAKNQSEEIEEALKECKGIVIFQFAKEVNKNDPEFNINLGGARINFMKTSRTLTAKGKYRGCFELGVDNADGEGAISLFNELMKQKIQLTAIIYA